MNQIGEYPTVPGYPNYAKVYAGGGEWVMLYRLVGRAKVLVGVYPNTVSDEYLAEECRRHEAAGPIVMEASE